jgi:two-component system cell cycle response regulator
VASRPRGYHVVTVDQSLPTILMIDDNPTKRFALKAILEPLNFPIVEAESGIEALRCLMRQDFAVILLDVMMPVMDGFQTAGLIRKWERSEMTPIIFITAQSRDDVAHTDHYADGAVDFIFAPVAPNELRAKVTVFANLFIRAEALASAARAVQSSADQLEVLNLELITIARRDPLTGLRNRRALSEDLDLHEAHALRYGHSYCIAVLDIDHFKHYNDAYGHQAGDEILQTVATRLTELLRVGDTLYRYGGEEFLCIFPEQTVESGSTAVERMRAGISDLAFPHPTNRDGVLTFSAGLAILAAGSRRSASEVLREADEALYRAKHLGRNRLEYDGKSALPLPPSRATCGSAHDRSFARAAPVQVRPTRPAAE